MTNLTSLVIKQYFRLRNTRITVNKNFIEYTEKPDSHVIMAGEGDHYVQVVFSKTWEPISYLIVDLPIPVTKYCFSSSPNFQTYLYKVEEYLLSQHDVIRSGALSLLI